MSRTRLNRDDRRAQLLDTAKAIVAGQGFHAVNMEAVARGAGVSRPIVYDHFGALDDLLVALLERETARALEQLAALVSGDSLLESFAAYLDAVAGDPVTWRIVLMPPEGTPEVLRAHIRDGRTAFASALAAGSVDSPDPQITGLMLQALADEGARLLLDGFDRERLVAHAQWLIGRLTG